MTMTLQELITELEKVRDILTHHNIDSDDVMVWVTTEHHNDGSIVSIKSKAHENYNYVDIEVEGL